MPHADLGCAQLAVQELALSDAALADASMPDRRFMSDHHAYLALMLDLASGNGHGFDIIHNHSLHYLPIAMAPLLSTPLVSTLHTPPTPWLESAIAVQQSRRVCFVGVSGHTARAWRHVTGPIDLTSPPHDNGRKDGRGTTPCSSRPSALHIHPGAGSRSTRGQLADETCPGSS